MSKTQFLPTYKGCLVCGQPEENKSTLNLRFRVVKNGVETSFKADSRQTGYEKIVHGGVICSLLDETIGWAVAVDIKKYLAAFGTCEKRAQSCNRHEAVFRYFGYCNHR